MKSRFWLTFADPTMQDDYFLSRNKEVNNISAILLLQRFVFGLALIYNYTKGHVTGRRLLLQFVGQLWHLIALALAWKFPKQM